MNFRKTIAHYFQNTTDYTQTEQFPLLVPDYSTGQMHELTDQAQQQAYRDLAAYTQANQPDFTVVMREHEGRMVPTAVSKASVSAPITIAEVNHYRQQRAPKC